MGEPNSNLDNSKVVQYNRRRWMSPVFPSEDYNEIISADGDTVYRVPRGMAFNIRDPRTGKRRKSPGYDQMKNDYYTVEATPPYNPFKGTRDDPQLGDFKFAPYVRQILQDNADKAASGNTFYLKDPEGNVMKMSRRKWGKRK